jgi:hypothetical protein
MEFTERIALTTYDIVQVGGGSAHRSFTRSMHS